MTISLLAVSAIASARHQSPIQLTWQDLGPTTERHMAQLLYNQKYINRNITWRLANLLQSITSNSFEN